MQNDDIVAISTPPGNGGVAVIRASGYGLKEKLCHFFHPAEKFLKQKPYTIRPYDFEVNKQLIDKILVSFFEAPRSYTGEDIIEINAHGGHYLAQKILGILTGNGFRIAQNGEFTKRAFLNGKIELTEAEAINALINAHSDLEIKSSVLQLNGELKEKIDEVKRGLVQILQQFNIDIDFVEHIDIEIDYLKIGKKLDYLLKETQSLVTAKEKYDRIHKGFEVIIAGQPNSGKSSLINRMIGKDEIIVHHTEGTTRDVIEKFLNIKDISLKLVDTAGLRETDNEVELIGIRKSKDRLDSAQLILYVIDSSNREKHKTDLEYIRKFHRNLIVIWNKTDLTPGFVPPVSDGVNVSAKTGENIDELKETIYSRLTTDTDLENEIFYIESRQLALFKEIIRNLEETRDELNRNSTSEIISFLLRQVLDNLNRVTGETKDIDIINEIFDNFCIGK